ncbi:hypothetical protein EDC01DRAFT_635325 [Geopyxis carbonaria]|nr:hypothetical protein EDC01DRAFT_635325 [Geopyxis carbonaria]
MNLISLVSYILCEASEGSSTCKSSFWARPTHDKRPRRRRTMPNPTFMPDGAIGSHHYFATHQAVAVDNTVDNTPATKPFDNTPTMEEETAARAEKQTPLRCVRCLRFLEEEEEKPPLTLEQILSFQRRQELKTVERKATMDLMQFSRVEVVVQ